MRAMPEPVTAYRQHVLTRTKVVATIGPASNSREGLGALLDAGVDVFRLNFSHGTLADHARVLKLARELAGERGQPLAILGDLCGPKIRLNGVAGGSLRLENEQMVSFVRGAADCDARQLTVSYPTLIDEVGAGQRIYIDDGQVRLIVVERDGDALVCRVTAGGAISPRKGVNLPDTRLSVPALTEKDRGDLAWALESNLEYVALSFVRRPSDVRELRALIGDRTSPAIIIKIEKVEALQFLEELVDLADGVMVARGDLGVEMDVWQVPLIQKSLVARCRDAGKPVIVATQMLQSMINSPSPTRAEVSDVANAIFEGADAVMLSAETAAGEFPSAAVEIMGRVAQATEAYLAHTAPHLPHGRADASASMLAITHGAAQTARDLGAKLVAVWSTSGATVRLMARHRLPMPVIGLTMDERVFNQMSLVYGVIPVRVAPIANIGALAEVLDRQLLRLGLAAAGDLIVVVASTKPTHSGTTDATLIHRVQSRDAGART